MRTKLKCVHVFRSCMLMAKCKFITNNLCLCLFPLNILKQDWTLSASRLCYYVCIYPILWTLSLPKLPAVLDLKKYRYIDFAFTVHSRNVKPDAWEGFRKMVPTDNVLLYNVKPHAAETQEGRRARTGNIIEGQTPAWHVPLADRSRSWYQKSSYQRLEKLDWKTAQRHL